MWDVISSGLGRALGRLLLAGIVYGAFHFGREAGQERGLKRSFLPALAICAFLAAITAGSLGNGTCENTGDPLRGGCEERADDGYAPTKKKIEEQFVYVLFLLLIPAALGMSEGQKRR
jgi:hypothetical protein